MPANPIMTRRAFVGGTAAGAVTLLFPVQGTRAQTVNTMGEVYVNGQRASMSVTLRPGDRVLTGPESTLTVAIGEDAFRLRPLTSVTFEGAPDSRAVRGMRVLAGALLGAFRKGEPRDVKTSTATIGIRGTAIYVEANPILTYVCTCYGEVALECNAQRNTKHVRARNHTPNYIFSRALSGRTIVEAPFINHTNAELAELEILAGRAPVLPVLPSKP